MNLQELCTAAGIECGYENIDIKRIKSNSEQIEKGDLFVCIKGLKTDGHNYIQEAQNKGAAAIVAERGVEADIPVVYTNNTRKALALLCNAYYGFPSKKLKLVAVTGTNGKTSVTYMLKNIFDSSMRKTGLIGTVSCYSGERKISLSGGAPLANMTTPDPEQLYEMLSIMANDGVEYVFMEASSHALALGKLEGLEFEAAIFTNLTPEHLDFHKTMENYFLAKAELFQKAKIKIINIDDKYGKRLYEKYSDAYACSKTKRCCGFFADEIIDKGIDGSEYFFVSSNRQFKIKTPLIGSFNVMNTLQAAACACALGISSGCIVGALSSSCGVNGRLERVKLGVISDYSVFVDYAHTPDALENLLLSVDRLRKCGERIVLLFGCGGDRDKSKRKEMGKIAAKLADFSVITSDNSRSEEPLDIINEIISGMDGACYKVIVDRAQAIEYVIKTAQKGDIILLAGKGHENYEIDKNGKRAFDEKKIASEMALKYY